MIKRVNFTGRRRIPRNRVNIILSDGQPRSFDAEINLSEFKFPQDAVVYLEASCAGSTQVKRFDFGKVGDITQPTDRTLTDFDGENVFFTLKVVDRTERFGRILGIAEHIWPQRAGEQTVADRRGILPVERVELGQQLWKLDFREREVFLLLNKSVPGLMEQVRSDPLFCAVVYPEVVRQILTRAIAENVEPDEEDDRWPILWLRFGKKLHPRKEDPPKPQDPEEDRDQWIEEVVDAFCNAHVLKDKYVNKIRANGTEP